MILPILMVLGAGIFRLAAHAFQWWNVAPLAAMALLGGIYLGRRYALWVPLAVLLVTDSFLNWQMGYRLVYWPRAFDYGAFLLIGILGLWVRQQKWGVKLTAALATPFLFFVISNFGVWLFGLSPTSTPYPKTFVGLLDCYTLGLPFLRGTLIGDWAFMVIFVSAMLLAQRAARPRFIRLAS
jgi:hypothetical protein